MADFLYNVPRSVLLHLVRTADKKAGYDDTSVRVSLLLDVDRGSIKSQRDYARIWGQSRKWVRYRWDDIWQDVTRWSTSNGRQLDSPMARNLPDEWKAWAVEEYGPKQGPTKGPSGAQKTPDESDTGGSGAHQGPTKGPHTIHPSSPSPGSRSPARARGDEPEDSFDPVTEIHETYAALPKAHPWHGFRLGILQLDRVRGEVEEPAALRESLRVWTEREYNPRNLDGFLDRYRSDVERLAAPEPDSGDEGGAGTTLPQHRPQTGGARRGGQRASGRAGGLRSTPEHRKSASDRRSEYGWDDASRDVDEALADLIAADAARRGAADGGGRDDG